MLRTGDLYAGWRNKLKMALRCLISLCLAVLFLIPAHAWSEDPVVALHVAPQSVSPLFPCDRQLGIKEIGCSNFSVDKAIVGTALDVFAVAVDSAPTGGISETNFGISMSPSIVVFNWTSCADGESPAGSWPQSGGGNRLVWNPSTNCQTPLSAGGNALAVSGAFYVYAYGDGLLEITPNSTGESDVFSVTDCSANEVPVLKDGGRVGWGTLDGFNPCLAETAPTNPSTWGRIKSQF